MRPLPKSRSGLIRRLKRKAEPHLKDSGFRRVLDRKKGIFGGTRPLRVWVLDKPIRINGFVLEEVSVITEDGVMEDAYGGGCVTAGWSEYPIEDLTRLLRRLEKAA